MLPEERQKRFGPIVTVSDLEITRAVDLGRYLTGSTEGLYVKLVEFRSASTPPVETAIFEVEVERPQHSATDIRRTELMATSFQKDDRHPPEALALREDFPQVLHTTLRNEAYPKGLCLYSQDFDEIRFTWTPANFIGRIREWLARAARGGLHLHDQPLEPLLMFSGFRLIIPHGLKAGELMSRPMPLQVEKTEANELCHTFVARQMREGEVPQKGEYLITTFQTPPVTHGVINKAPLNLEELQALYAAAGLDLVSGLRQRIKDWHLDHAQIHLLKYKLILLIFQPRKRQQEDASPETTERWAFCIPTTLEEIGKKLNIIDTVGGTGAGLLIGETTENNMRLHEIGLVPMVVYETLSARVARIQNQIESELPKITVIGAGALGSQVVVNLSRAGHSQWTIVDNDILLPHNCARHALSGWAVGRNKAEALINFFSDVLDEAPTATHLPINVLNLSDGNQEKLDAAFAEAGLICDFSASVAVSKMLSAHNKAKRCLSAFITPDSNSLVILVEDAQRQCRLDWLEMLHYRAVLLAETLGASFAPNGERFRYGNSCRDISISLPQSKLAIFAGISAQRIPEIFSAVEPRCAIFHFDPVTCSVTPLDVAISPLREFKSKDWTLRIDESTLNSMRQYRAKRLPNETGGILLGNFDTQRRICSVVMSVPSPTDSEEWPTCYIRGTKGLRGIVTNAELLTGGQVGYVGEWHSHPDRCSVEPSGDDKNAFKQLSGIMLKESLPAIIIIIGENDNLSVMI